MTLNTTTSRVAFAGDGSTTEFPFPYYFNSANDLVVISKSALGVETQLVINTHYTVYGANNSAGGSVTMLIAPATGTSLVVYRDPSLTQDLHLVENDPLPVGEIEKRFDKLTAIAQRLKDQVGRALTLTNGYAEAFSLTLPPVLTPGATLQINADGDALQMGPDGQDILDAGPNAAAAAASAAAAATSSSAAVAAATALIAATSQLAQIPALRKSTDIDNLTFNVQSAAGALVIALTDQNGSAPTSSSPCTICFRNTATGGGSFFVQSITSSISVTIPNGPTLGLPAGVSSYLYVYAIYFSGTVELGVSSVVYDEGALTSTSTIGSGTTVGPIYSTSARAGVPVRLIGRFLLSQTTAGTWNSIPTEILPNPFAKVTFGNNLLLNSSFDFWQRGTSVTVANGVSTYLADRWYVKNSLGTNGVITYSQVAGTLDQSKYAASVKITTAPTAAQVNGTELYQTLENADSLPLYNKLCSLSAKIKAYGNVNQVGIQFFYKTTEGKVDTQLGAEFFASVNSTNFASCKIPSQAMGTSQTKSGVIGVRIRITGVSSGNTYDLNNGFIVEQVMMTLGAEPTHYQRMYRSYAEELIACQRFYEKNYDLDVAPGSVTTTGDAYASTSDVSSIVIWYIPFKVTKRIITGTTSFWTFGGTFAAWAVANGGGGYSNTTVTGNVQIRMAGMAVVINNGGVNTASTAKGNWAYDAEI